MVGRKFTQEWKDNISKAKVGKTMNQESINKIIIIIISKTGKKEIKKSFSINKYDYVKALSLCFDLLFNKINYFEKLKLKTFS